MGVGGGVGGCGLFVVVSVGVAATAAGLLTLQDGTGAMARAAVADGGRGGTGESACMLCGCW